MTYRLRNLLIAIGLAVVAVIFVSVYVTQYKKHVQNDESAVQVYVAARNIPVGTPADELIDGKYLRKSSVEKRNVVTGALTTPEEIEADAYVTDQIFTGEQITLSRFGQEGAGGLRGELRGNQRAIDLDAEPAQTLAGTLEEGDHVDVVASWAMPEGSSHNVSRVILRDLLVLKAPESAGAGGGAATESSRSVRVVLRVTDTQAVKLFFMVENGKWTLTLRPPTKAGDSGETIKDSNSIGKEGISEGAFNNAMQGVE